MHTLPTRGFGVAGAMGIGAVATAAERGITQGRILDGLQGECKTGFNPLHDSHHVIFGQFAPATRSYRHIAVVALPAKIGSDAAEGEGFGGSKVEDDNKV